jgi:hypothetical protein
VTFGYQVNLSNPVHLDRENIADLAIAPMDLLHLGLQDSADDPFYFRIPKWGAAAVVDMAIFFTAHEYGHLSSISKSGYRSAVFGGKNTYIADQKGTNPFDLFVEGLKGGGGTAISVTNGDWQAIGALFAGQPDKLNSFLIAMKGGGLNQEGVILDRYADRLWEGKMSSLDTIPVGIGALSTLTYPSHVEMSDIADYSSLLKAEGHDVSPSRIKVLSAVTLLSGSTLAAFRGAAVGFLGGSQEPVHPFEIAPAPHVRIEAPDLENTLSETGPTLKASVRARLGALELRPSYERLFVGGKSMAEVGLSGRVPVTPFLHLDGAGFRNTDGGWWQEVGVDVRPWSWLTLGVGYSWAWAYTFHRDLYGSNNDLLEPRERNLKLSVGLSHRF